MIPGVRAALQGQGFPADTINDDGSLNPASLLALVYDEIEFRSSATPPIIINTKELLTPSTQPNPFLQWLKPTVVLRGSGQQTVIAPLGEAQGSWAVPLGGVAALVGLGFALGWSLK